LPDLFRRSRWFLGFASIEGILSADIFSIPYFDFLIIGPGRKFPLNHFLTLPRLAKPRVIQPFFLRIEKFKIELDAGDSRKGHHHHVHTWRWHIKNIIVFIITAIDTS
jgi:hypothetical protein